MQRLLKYSIYKPLAVLLFAMLPILLNAQDEYAAGNIGYDSAHTWSHHYQQWVDSQEADLPLLSVPSHFTYDTAALNTLLRTPELTGIRAYFGVGGTGNANFLKLMLVGVVGEIGDGNYGRDSVGLGVFTFSEPLTWTNESIRVMTRENPYQFTQSNYQRVYLDTMNNILQPRGRNGDNTNGAINADEFEMNADTAASWAAAFDSMVRGELGNYPFKGDTLHWPCAYLFTKEKLINGLDYDEDYGRFNNPMRLTIGINGSSEVELYITLVNTTGNGDIFNENADKDYSKILDYGELCPPTCGEGYLIECTSY